MKDNSYFVFAGLNGSVHVQFRSCQLYEIQVKFSGGIGSSEKIGSVNFFVDS